MAERPVLVTFFDPFGGESINPAGAAVRTLPPQIDGVDLVTCEVPTVFGQSAERVREAITAHRPQAVLLVGQAGGRAALTPERVAINIDDARIPDNAGQQPLDEPIVPGGPAALFATLLVKAMVAAIREAGVAAELSNTAGTFVCNHLMYAVLHHLAQSAETARVRAGFVHVPFLPEQVAGRPGVPAMSRDQVTRGLTAAIRAILTRREGDVAAPEGALH